MLLVTRWGCVSVLTCREPSLRRLDTLPALSATASATSSSPAIRCCATAWATATTRSNGVGGM